MAEQVRHPRLFSAFRAVLYLCAVAVATFLALVGVTALGAILVFGALSVMATGDVNLLAVGGFSALVVVLVAVALVGLSVGVRHVERRVEAVDRLPDPLDELKQKYVSDRIDEGELERRLDGVLDERETFGGRRPVGGGVSAPRRLEEEEST